MIVRFCIGGGRCCMCLVSACSTVFTLRRAQLGTLSGVRLGHPFGDRHVAQIALHVSQSRLLVQADNEWSLAMALCNPMQEHVPCMPVTSGADVAGARASACLLEYTLLFSNEGGPDTSCNFWTSSESTCVCNQTPGHGTTHAPCCPDPALPEGLPTSLRSHSPSG